MRRVKTCKRCQISLPISDFYSNGTYRLTRCKRCHTAYCSERYHAKKREINENRRIAYEKGNKIRKEGMLRRKTNKMAFIAYKGGECQLCGYKKCIGALEFHHKDPKLKKHKVTADKDLESQKDELDKCVLLCSNCHRTLHYDVNQANY